MKPRSPYDDPNFCERVDADRDRRLQLYELMTAIELAEIGKPQTLHDWLATRTPPLLMRIIRPLLVSRDKFKPKVNGRPREDIPPCTREGYPFVSAYSEAKRGDPRELLTMIRDHVTAEQGDLIADYFNTAFTPKRPTKRGRPNGSSSHPVARMERRIAGVVMRRLAHDRKAMQSTTVPRGHVAVTINDVADSMLAAGEFGELELSDANLKAVASIVRRGHRANMIPKKSG